jgi:Domain of unknown function (DUF5666)
MNTTPVFLLGLLAAGAVCTEAQQSFTLTGFVTRVESPFEFEVNANRVHCGAETQIFDFSSKGSKTRGCSAQAVFVGQVMHVNGQFHSQDHSLFAASIAVRNLLPDKISGSALIEALPAVDAGHAGPGSLLVRADGYRILIDRYTTVFWAGTVTSLAEIRPGDWINYKGALAKDGVVIAQDAKFSRRQTSRKEERFQKKSEFDPLQVPAQARRSLLHEVFVGIDYKHIPPYDDRNLRDHVRAIGEKLIPTFQRELPDDDPAKINFRFQLTNDPRWREIVPLSSGIILIPYKAVERMQNDSELAALLADGIARVLERSQYRMHDVLSEATIGSYMVFNPAIAAAIAAESRSLANSKEQAQSVRVSLGLLHDAGYDIDQAPIAWWLLAPKTPKPIDDTPLPARVGRLYRLLGEEWHNPAATPATP